METKELLGKTIESITYTNEDDMEIRFTDGTAILIEAIIGITDEPTLFWEPII